MTSALSILLLCHPQMLVSLLSWLQDDCYNTGQQVLTELCLIQKAGRKRVGTSLLFLSGRKILPQIAHTVHITPGLGYRVPHKSLHNQKKGGIFMTDLEQERTKPYQGGLEISSGEGFIRDYMNLPSWNQDFIRKKSTRKVNSNFTQVMYSILLCP